MKIFTVLIVFALLAFVGYQFISGNTALAIIILMGSAIFLPLLLMAVKHKLYFGSASHDATSASSGGTSGGVGPSGGGDC